MTNLLIAISFLALGIGIAEYYHYRIDRARRTAVPLDRPDLSDMWDLSHPAPQTVINAQDYAHLKRNGRMTKFVGGGRV